MGTKVSLSFLDRKDHTHHLTNWKLDLISSCEGSMKSTRAIFLFLIFIISFGRCWADTIGMLDQSSLACCTPVSHDHQDGEHEKDHPEKTDDQSDESQCSGCDLIESGFTSAVVNLDSPPPISFHFIAEWNDLRFCIQHIILNTKNVRIPPPEWSIDYLIMSTCDIVATSAVSVRGPDLV